jgi:hypothetical protein
MGDHISFLKDCVDDSTLRLLSLFWDFGFLFLFLSDFFTSAGDVDVIVADLK